MLISVLWLGDDLGVPTNKKSKQSGRYVFTCWVSEWLPSSLRWTVKPWCLIEVCQCSPLLHASVASVSCHFSLPYSLPWEPAATLPAGGGSDVQLSGSANKVNIILARRMQIIQKACQVQSSNVSHCIFPSYIQILEALSLRETA